MESKYHKLLEKAFAELDSFSIPAIGTFHRSTLAAKPDLESKKIFPPQEGIVLTKGNAEEKRFLKYLASTLKVPGPKAKTISAGLSERILNEIKKGKSIEISGLGKIFADPSGNPTFKSKNLGASQDLNLPVLPLSLPVVSEIANKPVVSPVESKLDQKVKEQTEEVSQEKKENKWLVWALLFFIIGGLGLGSIMYKTEVSNWLRDSGILSGSTLFNKDSAEVNNSEILVDSSASDSAKAVASEETSNSNEEQDSESDAKSDEKVTNTKKKKPENQVVIAPENEGEPFETRNSDSGDKFGESGVRGQHYLVAKTFTSGTSATEFAASLEGKKEYQPKVIRIKASKYYVTVYNNSDKRAVIRNMVKWKEDFKPNTWIYSK